MTTRKKWSVVKKKHIKKSHEFKYHVCLHWMMKVKSLKTTSDYINMSLAVTW